jgi:hypothetical protein
MPLVPLSGVYRVAKIDSFVSPKCHSEGMRVVVMIDDDGMEDIGPLGWLV